MKKDLISDCVSEKLLHPAKINFLKNKKVSFTKYQLFFTKLWCTNNFRKMIPFVKKYIFSYLILAFCIATSGYAQISIGTPNLGFSQICADATYNATSPFTVTFSFTPVSGLNPNNQFIVELSDSSGSFTNPTSLVSSNQGSITSSPASLKFSIPDNTAGENYRIRIKSTSPAATSPNSSAFAAYYKIQDSPFSINNFVSTATYCLGGSFVLNIDNPGAATNDSPLKYPSLTFNWFKEPNLTPIATGPSLTVNQPGVYYAETNYGTCTSNSYSNRVTISQGTNQSVSISSSLGNPFCFNGTPTTLSVQNANSYQWFKNNVPIAGATSSSYQTSEPGLYKVNVDFGGCSSTGSIDLQKTQINSTINIPEKSILQVGETITVTTTTDALNPTFQWYLNNTLISGASGPSIDINQTGDFKVLITQNSGCTTSDEILFTLTPPLIDPNATKIPNFISPNGDGINDSWIIPQEYTSGSDTEIIIMSATGELVFKTNDYQNNWPDNIIDFNYVNPVYYYVISPKNGKVKKGSITVVK